MPTIEWKMNNALTNDPCGICGARCDPTGFDPFMTGTWDLVCDACGIEYDDEAAIEVSDLERELRHLAPNRHGH